MSDTAAVQLIDVHKKFGSTSAVSGVDLTIADGEFFSMLGPSGSGKTTVLRMIAGFEGTTSGQILLADQDVTEKAPFERDLTTVFQDYALFPHMNVLDNVAYGLMVRKAGKSERREKALAALRRVQLEHLADRKPGQLSGGQRQRVALARALVVEPKVLLLDEPLSALDLKLRRQMQVELKELHRDLGITFLFVTHDQEEAMTMSDRIAVFNEGRIEQVGTPQEIYDNPQTEFVAGFVGTTNLLDPELMHVLTGQATPFAVRPERIAVNWNNEISPHEVTAAGEVLDCVYLGAGNHIRIRLTHAAQVITALTHGRLPGRPDDLRGRAVTVGWNRDDMVALPTPSTQTPDLSVA